MSVLAYHHKANHVVIYHLYMCEGEMLGYTQSRAIRHTLRKYTNEWICGTAFYAAYLPTYSQRIGELVKKGDPIERADCNNPNHSHTGTIAQYRWVEETT